MNLVAQEVPCSASAAVRSCSPARPAAELIGASALLVNPYDVTATA